MNDRTYTLCCCLLGQHAWFRVHNRPWRRLWRKTVFRICLFCGVPE